jgi:NADH:ubiquinone oxidoreductase subunit 5 (subunit L)/multisubunit Na+/H+ antiporter MnhA subunit
MFHAANHAFFQEHLLLSASLGLQVMLEERDMDKRSSLTKSLPVTYSLTQPELLAATGFNQNC